MRSNKLVSMDIDQLRAWVAFMDRAMMVSLIATIMAVAALGVTTWLSFPLRAANRRSNSSPDGQTTSTRRSAIQRLQTPPWPCGPPHRSK
jgi:hypothetical protein